MSTHGVLLVNLGTPDDCTLPAVKRYLREFLMDPRVLTMPAALRWMLVNFVIVPFRSPKSLEAYKTIWTDRGSPLRFHLDDLAEKIAPLLGKEVVVEVAMRYQSPSIESAVKKLHDRGVTDFVTVPLFPQYSSAAFGSAVEEVYRVLSAMNNVIPTTVIPPFYDHAMFIDAMAQQIESHISKEPFDSLLFSYHGLPESHCVDSELAPHCLRSKNCCDQIVTANQHCYRAQCFATTRALVEKLNLPDSKWTIGFQSRLGKTPWIQPYTDHVIEDLAKKGDKRVFVVCPAFTFDCLETVEEIDIRAREQFAELCGGTLSLIPCLNSDIRFAKSLTEMMRPFL